MMIIRFTLFLRQLPPMFPAAEPAPALAIFPAFIAVWFTFRVKFPAPGLPVLPSLLPLE